MSLDDTERDDEIRVIPPARIGSFQTYDIKLIWRWWKIEELTIRETDIHLHEKESIFNILKRPKGYMTYHWSTSKNSDK